MKFSTKDFFISGLVTFTEEKLTGKLQPLLWFHAIMTYISLKIVLKSRAEAAFHRCSYKKVL